MAAGRLTNTPVPTTEPSPFPLSGAILAGGRSSRMGRDKAFIPIHGHPLIAHQAALLRSLGIDDLIISGRPDIDYGIPDAHLVTDTVTDAGPLAGLAAILKAARHPWVLVLAVDLPKLTPAYLQSLVKVGAGRVGVVPHGPRGYEPLAALYPRGLLPRVEAALSEGRFSLQNLIEKSVQLTDLKKVEISQNDRPQFANWNTPQDTHD